MNITDGRPRGQVTRMEKSLQSSAGLTARNSQGELGTTQSVGHPGLAPKMVVKHLMPITSAKQSAKKLASPQQRHESKAPAANSGKKIGKAKKGAAETTAPNNTLEIKINQLKETHKMKEAIRIKYE